MTSQLITRGGTTVRRGSRPFRRESEVLTPASAPQTTAVFVHVVGLLGLLPNCRRYVNAVLALAESDEARRSSLCGRRQRQAEAVLGPFRLETRELVYYLAVLWMKLTAPGATGIPAGVREGILDQVQELKALIDGFRQTVANGTINPTSIVAHARKYGELHTQMATRVGKVHARTLETIKVPRPQRNLEVCLAAIPLKKKASPK
jgi:hypothetical protein